jgi:hypothetical protein
MGWYTNDPVYELLAPVRFAKWLRCTPTALAGFLLLTRSLLTSNVDSKYCVIVGQL